MAKLCANGIAWVGILKWKFRSVEMTKERKQIVNKEENDW